MTPLKQSPLKFNNKESIDSEHFMNLKNDKSVN